VNRCLSCGEEAPVEPNGERRAFCDACDQRGAFHAHLDKCERCRSQPFNLCDHGVALLRLAVQSIGDSLQPVTTETER
jgi:hypothetical protein